jgi:hypothetical protein
VTTTSRVGERSRTHLAPRDHDLTLSAQLTTAVAPRPGTPVPYSRSSVLELSSSTSLSSCSIGYDQEIIERERPGRLCKPQTPKSESQLYWPAQRQFVAINYARHCCCLQLQIVN